MRSVKILVVAGAASLLSSAAFAADMAIAPPPMPYAAPVADFGGWYLRGDIGFSNQSVQSIRNTNPALYANLLSLDEKTGFDTGGVFGLGAGYQFNNWFRVDVTGQYRGNSNFHGLDLTSFPNGGATGFGSDVYNASKSEWVFLANAYVDLGTWWSVRHASRSRTSPIPVLPRCSRPAPAWARASCLPRPVRSGTSHGRFTPVWPTRSART